MAAPPRSCAWPKCLTPSTSCATPCAAIAATAIAATAKRSISASSRGPSREAYADTDPGMRLSELEELVIELAEDDMEDVEQTQVRLRSPLAADALNALHAHDASGDVTPPPIVD